MEPQLVWEQKHEAYLDGYRLTVTKASDGWNWDVRIAGESKAREYGISDSRKDAMGSCVSAVWRAKTYAAKR